MSAVESVGRKTEETSEMKTDPTLTLNLLRINLPTLAMIGSTVWYTSAMTTELKDKVEHLGNQISLVEQKVEPVSTALYRVGVVEGQMNEASKKAEQTNTKFGDAIVDLTMSVKLLAAKIDEMSQKDPMK